MEKNDPKFAEQNSLKAILRDVKSLAGALAKANDNIHALAIRCMEHSQNYGDCNNTAAKLVDALPVSHRRSLLINWFAAFSPISIAKDGKTGNMKAHLSGKQEERVWNIEGAKATPFYAMPDAEREPDVPTYESVHNNVVAFIKRIEKKAQDIENPDDRKKALDEVDQIKRVAQVG